VASSHHWRTGRSITGHHRFVLVSQQCTALLASLESRRLVRSFKTEWFSCGYAAPKPREKKPDLRAAQRRRRLAVFREWNKGGTFAEIGRKLGLTGIRTREIVLKAVMGDGCRSERARAWMARLDKEGYWLSRYDAEFQKGSRKKKKGRLPAVRAKTSFSPETHIPKGDANVN
jgi:hypothetical protein